MTTKAVLLGSAAIAIATASIVPAQAEHFHGWYVGVEAGANWVKDWDFTSATTGLITPAHTHFDTATIDTGWAVLATTGYAWNDWRFELEAGYRENDADFTTSRSGVVVSPISTGDVRELSLMANVHYAFDLTDKLMFSLGAGAGMDKVKIDFNAIPGGNVDSWEFAYQGIAGLSYAIGSRTDLTLTYRYFHVDAPDLDFGPYNGHPFTDTEDLEKHTVTIGLRFDLTPDMGPPPPPPPPPVAAVAPEPPATSFVVFFAYNKCNITAEADRVLGQAASAAQSEGQARVTIVGHTDTSGSQRYNQKLSICRANAAAKNLVSKGVARSAISTSGRGETELLVQTADGVKEPQNRRATVDID